MTQLFSDFTERFEQRFHFCVADLHGVLSVLQLCGQAGSDGHTCEHVSVAVVVPHTAMNLTPDETGQHLLLPTHQPKRGFQGVSRRNVCDTLKFELPLIIETQ